MLLRVPVRPSGSKGSFTQGYTHQKCWLSAFPEAGQCIYTGCTSINPCIAAFCQFYCNCFLRNSFFLPSPIAKSFPWVRGKSFLSSLLLSLINKVSYDYGKISWSRGASVLSVPRGLCPSITCTGRSETGKQDNSR